MKNTLGFQCNCRELSHTDRVKSFLGTHLNNDGSPFVASRDSLATFLIERNVLDYTMLPSGMLNGHITQRIPIAIGAIRSPWARQKATCMLCGMHEITFLVNIVQEESVKLNHIANVQFPTTSMTSLNVLKKTQMHFHWLPLF